MTRRALPPREKIEIAERRGWRGLDGAMLSLENGKVCDLATGQPAEFDHIHALAMGGSNEDDNFRPMTPAEHKRKSREDTKARGKVRRVSGANKPKRTYNWPSRPFPKGRGFGIPGWRKTLKGPAVRI